MMSPKPNVVLICVDQWRGDCLSRLGTSLVRTPYLDELADRGALFRHAYSASPTCVPARMTMMTGLSAANHGRVGYQDAIPFDIECTLPAQFARAGYHTQAIGKMHYWPERVRIGFDDVILHDGYLHSSRDRGRAVEWYDDYVPWLRVNAGDTRADYLEDGLHCNSMVARPWDRPEALHPSNWVVTQATQWLYRRDPTQPFFLYLSFHRPHPPYDPPPWAFDQYGSAPDHVPPVGDWVDVFADHRKDNRPDAHVAVYDQQSMNRARAGYYGNMTHIDQQIERFLEVLGEFGLAQDTYICFTSDHGEMLGDHNMWRKGYPYEGSAHVPFILTGPGITEETVVDQVVELRDLMPTLLDCAQIPIPSGMDGWSVLPLLEDNHAPWREYFHGEHVVLGQSLQWIRESRWKYVWLSKTGAEQLFDLENDPLELHDAAKDSANARVLARCREHLIRELDGREEGFVCDGALVSGRPVVTALGHAGRHPVGTDHHPPSGPKPAP